MVNLAFVSGLYSFIVFLGHEVNSRPVTGTFLVVFFRAIKFSTCRLLKLLSIAVLLSFPHG